MKKTLPILILLSAVAVGCGTGYSWRSSVPQEYRTVCVPTFRNESTVMEAGAVAARQVLRELQREGTFRVSPDGEAAIEIQGKIAYARAGNTAYDRRTLSRNAVYAMQLHADVSVVDKRRGTVLIDNRRYTGETTFTTGQDISNAERDAAGRAADDIAGKVVDDLLRMDYNKGIK